jgi:hypothetical protein
VNSATPLSVALSTISSKWEVAFISTQCLTELCIGTGKITPVDVPYCPQCEEIPYERGCFYVRDGQNVAAQLAS